MLSRKAEDYLEGILNITEEKGYARIKDIAVTLGVRPPSVVEMVDRLNKKGLVEYRKYDGVKLTEEGKDIALSVKDRHDIIKSFLEIINVPEKIADEDACTMEHELHTITTTQIKNLVIFVKNAPEYPEWLKHFEEFCASGEHPCVGRDRKQKV
ncbi:MAG TPA: metal-dependent transcriptional regulator [Methanosarcinales archaeon]|nr:metal-dependent transcriptional regulator [Methanosarcinales archaeon]